MNIFLIIGLAKANDYLNKSWLLAGLYTIILLFEKLIQSAQKPNYISMFISIALSFAVAGGLFTLLNRFQDTVFTWLLILTMGVILLTYL